MAAHLKQQQLKLKIGERLSDEILNELIDQGTPETFDVNFAFSWKFKIQICLELLPHNLLNK